MLATQQKLESAAAYANEVNKGWAKAEWYAKDAQKMSKRQETLTASGSSSLHAVFPAPGSASAAREAGVKTAVEVGAAGIMSSHRTTALHAGGHQLDMLQDQCLQAAAGNYMACYYQADLKLPCMRGLILTSCTPLLQVAKLARQERLRELLEKEARAYEAELNAKNLSLVGAGEHKDNSA
jgi:hypothetical protein